MTRKITYDSVNDRLVFLMSAPDQKYWETLWRPILTPEAIKKGDKFVLRETQRVLPVGARVIDAGCGIGATVSGLTDAGFDACGIDYAEETVSQIKSIMPDLKVQVADVRALPFGDGQLDGIWSLGVIEHFYDGFEPLILEAYRALRPGGYLFLTVPVISPFKALKIKLGLYRSFQPENRELFFQFGFRSRHVIHRISAIGFILRREYGRSGAFGLTEDAPSFCRALALRQDSESILARAWWRLIDKAISPISCHVEFFLFQKV